MVHKNAEKIIKAVLTIAGSDPSGGAGVQADLKVFHDLRVKGLSAVTALTAQTEDEISAVHPVHADILTQQLSAAVLGRKISAVKIGMVATAANIYAIELFLHSGRFPHVVIDPVMNSTSGVPLLEPRALNIFKEHLLPLATLITPNLAEAETLSGIGISDVHGMRKAARIIFEKVCRYGGASHRLAILVKGGHLKDSPVDVLYDEGKISEFKGKRLTQKNIHGTGCVLSSAIAVHLAKGKKPREAVALARKYVEKYIKSKI